MRTCQTCGLENPPDRDFCECGEYLRWEPTGLLEAIKPEPTARPPASDARPPPEPAGQTPAVIPKTAVQGAVPARPRPPEAYQDPNPARITLRLPDRDAEKEQALATAVEAGQRERVLALVRNQSDIVDNYQLRIDGLPEDWWSIYPDTVYLVPFATGGAYEQEVEIHLHPPRTPDAEAKTWDLRVVAHSKAGSVTAAFAPLGLVIRPYTETTTRVRPERAKGRRRANFDVDVENKANAPVLVALEGEDPDGELRFGFNRPPSEIPPGQTVTTTMQVRPPKQIWIGRGLDRRLAVKTLTGQEAEARLAAEPTTAEDFKGAPGVYGPRVFKPQVYGPGMNVGPGGVSFRKPQLTGPQMQGPQMKNVNVDANSLRRAAGSGGPSPAPSGPLLPSQAVFRQKAWLPWWLIPVAVALAAVALVLYLLLPKNVVVPDVVGSASTFEAEQTLTDAELKLAAVPKEKVDADAPPGSVLSQTPKAGEKAEKDSEVSLLVAVGNGKTRVPDLAGLTLARADAKLRDNQLTLGPSSPQPPDPDGKIETQIPAAGEEARQGEPVAVFLARPKSGDAGDDGGDTPDAPGDTGGDGAVTIPPIAGADPEVYAQTVADLGLLPETEVVSARPPAGTLFATRPRPGRSVATRTKIRLLVSAGPPLLAYDDDEDVRLVDELTRKELTVARTPGTDKDPALSPDGTRIAYQSDGQLFLTDRSRPGDAPDPITPAGEHYSDLAFAPTPREDILAVLRLRPDGGKELCFTRLAADEAPRCADAPTGIRLDRKINWSPDGRSILVYGRDPLTNQLGMVLYTSRRAFSPAPRHWSTTGFATRVTDPGVGVLDAAFSPDGKRMAVVANFDRPDMFQVSLTVPGDYSLAKAEPLPVIGCKVAWRPDSRELVVVRSDNCDRLVTGELRRVPISRPRDQESLDLSGDNPAFQPLPPTP